MDGAALAGVCHSTRATRLLTKLHAASEACPALRHAREREFSVDENRQGQLHVRRQSSTSTIEPRRSTCRISWPREHGHRAWDLLIGSLSRSDIYAHSLAGPLSPVPQATSLFPQLPLTSTACRPRATRVRWAVEPATTGARPTCAGRHAVWKQSRRRHLFCPTSVRLRWHLLAAGAPIV